MENTKKKQLKNLRVIATNIFMSLTVIAIVATLTLLAMGYSLSRDGGLEQSGLVQIRSAPSGASVEIGGDLQSSRTEMSKMLATGSHDILITKPGYDTWTTTLNIEAGLLTRIDWIRLFPIQKITETVHSYTNLHLVSHSPDRQHLALLEADSSQLQIINIRSDEIIYSHIDLDTISNRIIEYITPPNYQITSWNNNNDKFLLKDTSTEYPNWLLIDTKKPENSLHLTLDFSLNFTDIQFANDAGNKLWVLESSNLRLLDTVNTNISAALAIGVQQFTANTSTVAHISVDQHDARTINIYREGEKGSPPTQKTPASTTAINLALGANWQTPWLAFHLDNRLFVYSGKYPTHPDPSTMSILFENDLDFTPTTLAANPTSRLVVAFAPNKYTVADTQLKQRHSFDLTSTSIKWLDDFLLYSTADNQLTVTDFDGTNQRPITPLDPTFPAIITPNNRWLYFIAPAPQPEQDNTQTTQNNEPTTPFPTHQLHRQRL